MMNRNAWLVAACTFALLVLAVWLKRPDGASSSADAVSFLPANAAVDAEQVVLNVAGQTITLHKNAKHWQIAERGNYPAQTEKVVSLLKALQAARISEHKTADASRYDRLGLHNASAQRVRLRLQKGEQILADIWLGNSVTRPAGHFVRRDGEAQTYLLDRELSVGHELRDWMQTEIVNLPAAQIQSVERILVPPAIQCIRAPCEAPVFSLSKADDKATEFTMADLPAKKVLAEAYVLSSLSDALNALSAQDALAAADFRTEGQVRTTRFRSFDGLLITTTHSMKADKHYLSVSAASTDTATAEVKQRADEINQHCRDWVFEINNFKGEGFARDQDDLLKDAGK